jgi:tRNA dimethylallyltransferase
MFYNLITILGHTAGGKTSVAAQLAARLNGEVISADSRQVYRGMDIGTGKDLDDYLVNGTPVPYHLIDIADAGEQYNVYEYQKDFIKVYHDITERDKTVILCGGTGLYIEAVLKGYKLIHVPVNQPLRDSLKSKTLDDLEQILATYKKLHNKTDTDTVKRAIRAIEIEQYYTDNPGPDIQFPEIKSLNIGIKFDRESRRKRISERLHSRLEEGMVDEVQRLLDSELTPDQLIYYGLEYKYITQYLTGELSHDEMVNKLEIAIHQFAKRQMIWYRGMERKGTVIHWLDGYMPLEEKLDIIIQLLETGTK